MTIIFYFFLLIIASILIMFLLGFIDIVYTTITGKPSNMGEKFGEAMEVILGLIATAVCAVGVPIIILCLLAAIVMVIIG